MKKLELCYKPGENIPPATSQASRVGVFIVIAPDREELERRVQWVYDRVVIVVER